MPKRQSFARSQTPAQQITAAIIEKLRQGTKPWVRPWRGVPVSRPLRACGTPYRGMNVFWLWMVADAAGFCSPYWMTYRQCRSLGGQVRRGEKATIAILYKSYETNAEREDGHESEAMERRPRRALRAYPVFNTDQCDALPGHYRVDNGAIEEVEPGGREERLDRFFANVGATLRHQGCEAYYEPAADRITLPPASLFDGYDHYYATLAHELSHWTGHASRLARDLKNRFGSAAYAAEELVAELSAAIVGAELGLPVAHLDSHASYIADWLALLQSDERAILTAAARAEEAAGLLLQLGGHVAPGANDRAA